jgi:armadillo repeat-containing protein 6
VQAAIAAGAEAAVRNAKAKFPSACGDVGSAALRDMGCDNYSGSVSMGS